MHEEEIIRNLYPEGECPQDDCFLWRGKTLFTTDSLTEGTHFKHEWSSPADIAQKIIEVNLSDITASGGVPVLAFLNLGLSPLSSQNSWVEVFSRSFTKRLGSYGIQLAGGDTFRSPVTTLTLTLVGEIPAVDSYWARSKIQPGDYLYLTGSVGLSQLGFQCLSGNAGGRIDSPDSCKPTNTLNLPDSGDLVERAIGKHLRPLSRFPLAERLREFPIHACMDITDGLVQDAQRLGQSSGLGLTLEITRLPDTQEILPFLGWDGILSSGEELELLFTSPTAPESFPQELDGIRVTCLGRAEADLPPGVHFLKNGVPYAVRARGFEHFESSAKASLHPT